MTSVPEEVFVCLLVGKVLLSSEVLVWGECCYPPRCLCVEDAHVA